MPTKVTIYSIGQAGQIVRSEGRLVGIVQHAGANVVYMPKRGKKEDVIPSYLSPFWMVVEGWGHPSPSSAWEKTSKSAIKGVRVQKGRYRGTDPRWVKDFLDSIGNRLHSKIIATFNGGKLKIMKPSLIPSQNEDREPATLQSILEEFHRDM